MFVEEFPLRSEEGGGTDVTDGTVIPLVQRQNKQFEEMCQRVFLLCGLQQSFSLCVGRRRTITDVQLEPSALIPSFN